MATHRFSWDEGRGYLKACRFCGERIYLLRCRDGAWRPFESWVAGNADQGEWSYHDCPTADRRAA